MTHASGSLYNIDNEARRGMLLGRCTQTDIERRPMRMTDVLHYGCKTNVQRQCVLNNAERRI